MCECFASVYVCVPHICYRGQKVALDPSELKLRVVEILHWGDENLTWVLCKSNKLPLTTELPHQPQYSEMLNQQMNFHSVSGIVLGSGSKSEQTRHYRSRYSS